MLQIRTQAQLTKSTPTGDLVRRFYELYILIIVLWRTSEILIFKERFNLLSEQDVVLYITIVISAAVALISASPWAFFSLMVSLVVFDCLNNVYGLISAYLVFNLTLLFFYRIHVDEGERRLVYFILLSNVLLLNLVSGFAHLLDPEWRSMNALTLILSNDFYSRVHIFFEWARVGDNVGELSLFLRGLTFIHLLWSILALPCIFFGRYTRILILAYGLLFSLFSGVLLELSYLPLLTVPISLLLLCWYVDRSPYDDLRSLVGFLKIRCLKTKDRSILFCYIYAVLCSWVLQPVIVFYAMFLGLSNLRPFDFRPASFSAFSNNPTVLALSYFGRFFGVISPNVFSSQDYNAGRFFRGIVVLDVHGNERKIRLIEDGKRVSHLRNNYFLYNVGVTLPSFSASHNRGH